MDHREQRILKKIMSVQPLRPHEQQVAKQITRDTYNMSYIIWAFAMLATTGAFMYVIGKNTESQRATQQELRNTQESIATLIERQNTTQVYIHSLEREINKGKEQ